MKLRKLFGLQTVQEKIDEYNALKDELDGLDALGQSLTERFSIQKSILDEVSTIPEENKVEVMRKHNEFLINHQKEVAQALNKRQRIIKSIDRFKQDSEIGDFIRKSELLDKTEKIYDSGKITRKDYFNIIKAITGKPTKYADVVAFNPDGKILILHRLKDFTPDGTVCVPGGHVDPGESFEEAAIRELKEETNLDIDKNLQFYKLGEYKCKDAHIEYYVAHVDPTMQTITLDAEEHCFAEWITVGEIASKPFIFDQGENILKMLFNSVPWNGNTPTDNIIKAYKEGKITEEGLTLLWQSTEISDIEKSMGDEEISALKPESLEGGKRKLTVPVRDPFSCLGTIIKGISGAKDIQINDDKIINLSNPLVIDEVLYKDDPSKDQLVEMEVVFAGDDGDMKKIIEKFGKFLEVGELKVRTLHDEFLSVNANGTDYIGDPIFSYFEKNQ